jgi:hypothetical protein
VPRDLGDVLHYFLPETEDRGASPSYGRGGSHPAALPTLALPVGNRDVVRAALAWNLCVEIARLGGSVSLVTRSGPDASLLWPGPGPGPVGTDVVHAPADGLGALCRAALDVAVSRAPEAREGGVVLVCLPPAWLRPLDDGRALLRWVLLFSTAEPRELMETYALAKPLLQGGSEARVGVTIHGARRVADAEGAFHRLSDITARHLGRTPVSYGLLVDDLHVYRAIVARRPIGLEHPQSPAARALRDVARLVLEDARKAAVV